MSDDAFLWQALWFGAGVFAVLMLFAWVMRPVSSYDAASRRWKRINAAERAAGCPCGAEVTHVRHVFGTVGSVDAEIWTCAEHTNVNCWQKTEGDLHSTPVSGVTFDDMSRWVGPAVRVRYPTTTTVTYEIVTDDPGDAQAKEPAT